MKNILTKSGLKITKTRLDILKILENTIKPLNAYEIQKQLKDINISTVYRVLQKLIEVNLIHKIDKLNSYTLCNKVNESCKCHHLFICNLCNKVIEFIDHSICEIQNKLAFKNKFKTASHSLEIMGVCNNCNN